MLPWQPFVMNVTPDRKVKKLAYLPGYWSDLAQIWCKGVFLDSKSKINKKFLYDVILTSKWHEGKIFLYRLQKMHMTSLWRHLLFDFFENVNFSSSYKGQLAQQIWFNLGQGKQSYGGGAESAPQVENELNRPGEIGLTIKPLNFDNFSFHNNFHLRELARSIPEDLRFLAVIRLDCNSYYGDWCCHRSL